MTCQKMTLFHLVQGWMLAAGVGIGAVSLRSHGVAMMVAGGTAGLVGGVTIAWLLPRAVWKMLWLLNDWRWFLQPAPPPAVPVISREEFHARTRAKDRDQNWHAGIWIGGFFAVVVGFNLLFASLKRIDAPDWFSLVGLIALIGFIVGFLVLHKKFYNRLVNKHGLACPNCGTEIAGVGPCWHCGTTVVETNTD
jgi:hypothetical protein